MDETHCEVSLIHERIVSFTMVLLIFGLGLIVSKQIIEGNVGLKMLIIALGVIVGIIGIMIIISTFYEEAPILTK